MNLKTIKKGLRIIPINLSWALNKALVSPMLCTIFITKRCNSRCTMCDDWQTPKDILDKELTTEEIKVLIRDVKSMGTQIFNISGGEPLMRRDLFELMDYAQSLGLEVKISSNAMLINEKIAKKLAKSIDFISVSLDGSNPEVHDNIRGVKSSFDLAVRGLKNFVKARDRYNKNLKITISTTVSKANIKDLPKIVELAEELGTNHITFNPVQFWVFLPEKERDELLPTPEQMKKTMEILKKMKKQGRHIRNTVYYLDKCVDYIKNPKMLPLNCKIPYLNTYIDALGNVSICPNMGKPLGNIREKKLSKIWKSQVYNKNRAAIKKGHCSRCWWTCTSEINLLYSPKNLWRVAKDAMRYMV